MMKIWMLRITLALILSAGLFQPALAQQSADMPLTNASVVKLVRAGFKEKTVIAIIRTRPTQFDLAPDRLIELKRSGVSERVILAMLALGEMADEGWEGDPFFDDSSGPSRAKRGSGTGDGGTDIFGSSGSSSNRSRGTGVRGDSGGDTQTTGSATVRILRPPAEASAPPKLERTPTLTNDSIVELVEAGFSEGTIIRRIEQSPAEFDLTPPKLAELRRRRVSDRIIAAMRAAMGEDSTSSTTLSNSTPEK